MKTLSLIAATGLFAYGAMTPAHSEGLSVYGGVTGINVTSDTLDAYIDEDSQTLQGFVIGSVYELPVLPFLAVKSDFSHVSGDFDVKGGAGSIDASINQFFFGGELGTDIGVGSVFVRPYLEAGLVTQNAKIDGDKNTDSSLGYGVGVRVNISSFNVGVGARRMELDDTDFIQGMLTAGFTF